MNIQERLDGVTRRLENDAERIKSSLSTAKWLAQTWKDLNELTRAQNMASARGYSRHFPSKRTPLRNAASMALTEDLDAQPANALLALRMDHSRHFIKEDEDDKYVVATHDLGIHYQRKVADRTLTEIEYNAICDGDIDKLVALYSVETFGHEPELVESVVY